MFVPNELDTIYLDRIQQDTGKSNTDLFRHIIAQYYIMQYGVDAHREARQEYTEIILNDKV